MPKESKFGESSNRKFQLQKNMIMKGLIKIAGQDEEVLYILVETKNASLNYR